MFKTLLPRLCAALFACAFGAATADPATPPPALTLAMAQARVLQANPALQALALEVAAHDGAVRQAGALPNPELSALVEDRNRATRTTTIELTQAIETGGKRGARIDAAQRERDMAQAALLAKKAELRADTGAAFFTVLAAQAQLALAEQSLALADQGAAAAALRVAAGKNSPVDETRARIAASGAAIALAQSRGELDNAREMLASLWGGAGTDLGPVTGRLDQLPELAPLALLSEGLRQAPAVVQARLELARRTALGRVETSRRSPDLAVTVGGKHDEQFGRRQAVFGLSLPLPLFDRNQGGIAQAQQRTDIARAGLAAAELSVAGKLRMAHASLALARRQAEALERGQLQGAQASYEATRKGYEYGKFTILDVFEAQRVFLETKAQHLRALAAAHAAGADIERILGATGAVQPLKASDEIR